MLKEKSTYNCTYIISSCDAYKDLWAPFFMLKHKYWSDCPFNSMLICETEKMFLDNVYIYNTGLNFSWSKMLKMAIKKCSTKYILLSMEDFFFQSKVDNHSVLSLYNYVKKNDVNMLRLIPRPGPNDKFPIFRNIGGINSNALYRVSGQAAFWKSSILLELLDEKESLWEFEINATQRSYKYEKFYSVYKPVLTYKHHVVERGKWFIWSAFKFKITGVPIDLKSRKVMSIYETFVWVLHKYFSKYLIDLNPKIKNLIKPLLKRANII